MYTTMFSLVLASAGLASNAQYGGGGGSGVWGDYGQFDPRGAVQYYYNYPYQVIPWQNENSKVQDLEKRCHDLTDLLKSLVARQKDMEAKLEQQDRLAQIAEANAQLHAKLMEAIGKIKPDVTPAALESLETRMRAYEASKHEAATSEILTKIVRLLEEKYAKSDPILMEISTKLGEISKIVRMQESAKIQSSELTGYALTRGLIIVSLPADATLLVDNFASTVGSNQRSFISPDLEPGKTYFYNLHLEVMRNNKTYVADQRVFFQPGREYRVSFDNIEAALAGDVKKD